MFQRMVNLPFMTFFHCEDYVSTEQCRRVLSEVFDFKVRSLVYKSFHSHNFVIFYTTRRPANYIQHELYDIALQNYNKQKQKNMLPIARQSNALIDMRDFLIRRIVKC